MRKGNPRERTPVKTVLLCKTVVLAGSSQEIRLVYYGAEFYAIVSNFAGDGHTDVDDEHRHISHYGPPEYVAAALARYLKGVAPCGP